MTEKEAGPVNPTIRCACGHPDLSASTNQQYHLVRIPDGPLTRDCFKLVIAGVPEPKGGEVLLRVQYISIDAANLVPMQGAGMVMAGQGLGEVIESLAPDFEVGDLVFGECGWQEYAALPGTSLVKQPHADANADVVAGFDNLPDALIGLLHGENRGKRMVRIA